MLSHAYGALKRGNPNAFIVFGGVALEDTDNGFWFNFKFTEDVLKTIKKMNISGNKKEGFEKYYFDVMNFHYYRNFHKRWDKYGDDIIGKAEYLRQKLATYKLYKPFIVTECGLRAGEEIDGKKQTEDDQARYIFQVYARSFSARISAMTWYPLSDWPEYSWGLINTKGEEKPSFIAYKTLIKELTGFKFTGIISTEDIEGYVFVNSKKGARKEILWSKGLLVQKVFNTKKLRVVTYKGDEYIINSNKASDLIKTDSKLNVSLLTPIIIEYITK